MCSDKLHIILDSLRKVEESILLLQEWNEFVTCSDDYLMSPEGMKNLAASSMLIEAIGETFKKIDNATNGTLLPSYPDVPWKAVKGIRDHIAHGYFEIDSEIIFDTIKNGLPELLKATRFFINHLKNNDL